MEFEGTPSDRLPDVLATGVTDVRFVFVSMSTKDPDGRDAAYFEWHGLDHRPEQYRLAGLRNALRLVSTPACRSVRAANAAPFDAVDNIMTYMFSSLDVAGPFLALGRALDQAGRMPHRLPAVATMMGELASKAAPPRVVAGADVIPWRPALGVYLIVEKGQAPAHDLVDVPGVAGVWSFHGASAPPSTTSETGKPFPPNGLDVRGQQITYCYLDADPVETGKRLGEHMKRRWASGAVQGLLAAPFFTVTPFDWGRHVP